MAQPTPYFRQYNFTNYQAVSPSTPLPADKVDLEFNSVKSTLDQVLSNLKIIQRDDTALANKSVGLDQLKDEVSVGVNAPTPWATTTAYVSNDTVFYNGVFYKCETSHTSGVFATDLGAGKWSVIADFTAISYDLAGGIHNATEKTTPVDGDEMAISDSGDAWKLKKVTFANFKSRIVAEWGALIAARTAKTTPVDADVFSISDSAASNATKGLTWANVKATLWAALGPAIAGFTGKTTPVAADSLVIQDSAATNATKQVTMSSLWSATVTALGPLIAAITGKPSPVDADGVLIADSAATNASKFTTFTQMWTNYFKGRADALYQPLATVLTSLASLGASLVSGDVLYATAANTLARLAKGTDGQVLTLASGVPSWATPAVGASTTYDAVGSYALLITTSGTNTAAGSTLAGTNLVPANAGGTSSGGARSGTWKAMGFSEGASGVASRSTTLWVRTA